MAKEDEWQVATSYSRVNRLLPLGITNKHAAIKGLPILDDDEAKAVAREILLAIGLLRNKKQKAAHENGNCMAFVRPFYFKGKMEKLTRRTS